MIHSLLKDYVHYWTASIIENSSISSILGATFGSMIRYFLFFSDLSWQRDNFQIDSRSWEACF
jgi:hypothetical protein